MQHNGWDHALKVTAGALILGLGKSATGRAG